MFVDGLDLAALGFEGVEPLALGQPAYRPATLLKIYIYGYLNRVPSSRRLERECQRNLELIWLTGRLAPDHKTIADFRKDNGKAIAKVCREFVMLCRKLGLLSVASVAVDGSKFKAVNAREKNFTEAKMKRRLERIEASIARYLSQLETASTMPLSLVPFVEPQPQSSQPPRLTAPLVPGTTAWGWTVPLPDAPLWLRLRPNALLIVPSFVWVSFLIMPEVILDVGLPANAAVESISVANVASGSIRRVMASSFLK